MEIGDRIKAVLFEKNLSAKWLAEQLECERTNVYNIFNRKDISLKLLERISATLDHNFFQELADDFDQR